MMHKLKATDTSTSADWKAARSWIVRANRADTEDALPLYVYYQSFREEGAEPPSISIDGLSKATALLPQADSFRFAYVYELAKKARYKEAANYLRPIANSPHGGDKAAYAQRLTLALRKAADAKPGTVDLSDIYGGLDMPVQTPPVSPLHAG